jgi:hypothetical protein
MSKFSPRRIPGTWAYLVLVVALYFVSLLLPREKPIADPLMLTEPAEANLALIKDVFALVGTWAAGLFAAAAAVAVKGREWSHGWRPLDSVLVVAVLACGVLVYYGIYLGYTGLLGMTESGGISPFAPEIDIAISIQYYAALAGTLLLGLVFSRMLDKRINKPPAA